jgi:hypothetical protein
VFESPKALAAIYPALVYHAMHHFQSPDVMRFLARKSPGNFTAEITTRFKDRPEGVRVKHGVRGNSVKMDDKAGSVLRVETTIAKTADLKVYRPRHDDPEGRLEWRPLRQGVADLHRRAELSQRSNERYLDALAAVDDPCPCACIFEAVSRPVSNDGRRFRALRIGDAEDLGFLQAISGGELATAGFRNRDIRCLLDPTSRDATPQVSRRLAAKITRRLRLLRAHGIIRKIPRTHRYMLTERGPSLTAALFAMRDAHSKQRTALAA